MAHSHDHGPGSYGKAFAIGITLNAAFVVIEVVYGTLGHSLALVADAGHNLGDVLGLVLAWGATFLSRRRPTARHTYGWRGSTILAALANAMLLLIATGAIAWEAVQRLRDPSDVAGKTVIVVAAIGVAINAVTAVLFMSGRKHDINLRAAFAHLAADAVLALGVVVTGIVIVFTGWQRLDPIASLVIALVIVVGTWDLLRDSFNLALAAVPEDIDAQAVTAYLAAIPGVTEVHDLHIWAMSTTEVALTVHLVRPEGGREDALLSQLCAQLHDRFGIEHATIQLEHGDPAHPCRLTSAAAV